MNNPDTPILLDAAGAKLDGTQPKTTLREIVAKYPHCSILTEAEKPFPSGVDRVVVVTGAEPLPEDWRFELAQVLDAGGAIAIHATTRFDLQTAVSGIFAMLPAGRA